MALVSATVVSGGATVAAAETATVVALAEGTRLGPLSWVPAVSMQSRSRAATSSTPSWSSLSRRCLANAARAACSIASVTVLAEMSPSPRIFLESHLRRAEFGKTEKYCKRDGGLF